MALLTGRPIAHDNYAHMLVAEAAWLRLKPALREPRAGSLHHD